MEIIRPLRIGNILENVAQLRSAIQTIAVKGKPRTSYYSGSGPLPKSVISEFLQNSPTGDCAWIYYGMTYGPTAQIRKYKLDIIDAEFKKVPGARRIDPSTLPQDEYYWSRDRIAAGIPDLHELLWVNWVPNGAHIAFSPVSPIRGDDATKLLNLAKRRHEEFGIDFFPAYCVGLREMHLIIEIVFDNADKEARRAAEACMRAMIEDAAKEGYGEYRTHLAMVSDSPSASTDWASWWGD